MNLRISLTAVALAASALIAHAEVLPSPTPNDSRIQTIRYERDIVIRVNVAEGVVSTIELGPKEIIKDFALGDSEAWRAVKNGNLFAFKPKAEKPDTNLTIYTDKRAYLFELVSVPRRSKNVAYWVRLEYDNEGPDPAEVQAAKLAAERKQIEQNLKAAKTEGPLNYDYWISGPKELQPVEMHDNGRSTYLTFSAAHAMPAPFIVEPDKSESLVDYHVEGDTMVLHRVVDKVVLRRGEQVAAITNKSLYRPAQSSATATESDKVKRAIRNGKDE